MQRRDDAGIGRREGGGQQLFGLHPAHLLGRYGLTGAVQGWRRHPLQSDGSPRSGG